MYEEETALCRSGSSTRKMFATGREARTEQTSRRRASSSRSSSCTRIPRALEQEEGALELGAEVTVKGAKAGEERAVDSFGAKVASGPSFRTQGGAVDSYVV